MTTDNPEEMIEQLGGGWYELPNEMKVHGKETALEIAEGIADDRWSMDTWNDHPLYDCEKCPYSTVEKGKMIEHWVNGHAGLRQSEE